MSRKYNTRHPRRAHTVNRYRRRLDRRGVLASATHMTSLETLRARQGAQDGQ